MILIFIVPSSHFHQPPDPFTMYSLNLCPTEWTVITMQNINIRYCVIPVLPSHDVICIGVPGVFFFTKQEFLRVIRSYYFIWFDRRRGNARKRRFTQQKEAREDDVGNFELQSKPYEYGKIYLGLSGVDWFFLFLTMRPGITIMEKILLLGN